MTRQQAQAIRRHAERQAYQDGLAAGQRFQEEFDRTGGRNRRVPKPPAYDDKVLLAAWQQGFERMTVDARREMTCADCGKELNYGEEQVCNECLDQYREV